MYEYVSRYAHVRLTVYLPTSVITSARKYCDERSSVFAGWLVC